MLFVVEYLKGVMFLENVHFFTFGNGHDLAGYCQPIIADSPELARQCMFDKYGSLWAFQYTADEYIAARNEGTANELMLNPIRVVKRKRGD